MVTRARKKSAAGRSLSYGASLGVGRALRCAAGGRRSSTAQSASERAARATAAAGRFAPGGAREGRRGACRRWCTNWRVSVRRRAMQNLRAHPASLLTRFPNFFFFLKAVLSVVPDMVEAPTFSPGKINETVLSFPRIARGHCGRDRWFC